MKKVISVVIVVLIVVIALGAAINNRSEIQKIVADAEFADHDKTDVALVLNKDGEIRRASGLKWKVNLDKVMAKSAAEEKKVVIYVKKYDEDIVNKIEDLIDGNSVDTTIVANSGAKKVITFIDAPEKEVQEELVDMVKQVNEEVSKEVAEKEIVKEVVDSKVNES